MKSEPLDDNNTVAWGVAARVATSGGAAAWEAASAGRAAASASTWFAISHVALHIHDNNCYSITVCSTTVWLIFSYLYLSV